MAGYSKEDLVQLVKRFGAYLTLRLSDLFKNLVRTSFPSLLSTYCFRLHIRIRIGVLTCVQFSVILLAIVWNKYRFSVSAICLIYRWKIGAFCVVDDWKKIRVEICALMPQD